MDGVELWLGHYSRPELTEESFIDTNICPVPIFVPTPSCSGVSIMSHTPVWHNQNANALAQPLQYGSGLSMYHPKQNMYDNDSANWQNDHLSTSSDVIDLTVNDDTFAYASRNTADNDCLMAMHNRSVVANPPPLPGCDCGVPYFKRLVCSDKHAQATQGHFGDGTNDFTMGTGTENGEIRSDTTIDSFTKFIESATSPFADNGMLVTFQGRKSYYAATAEESTKDAGTVQPTYAWCSCCNGGCIR